MSAYDTLRSVYTYHTRVRGSTCKDRVVLQRNLSQCTHAINYVHTYEQCNTITHVLEVHSSEPAS
jgi:hypothetical protein